MINPTLNDLKKPLTIAVVGGFSDKSEPLSKLVSRSERACELDSDFGQLAGAIGGVLWGRFRRLQCSDSEFATHRKVSTEKRGGVGDVCY